MFRRRKINPFHEIKKYTSWYWGSEPAGKPKFTPTLFKKKTLFVIHV